MKKNWLAGLGFLVLTMLTQPALADGERSSEQKAGTGTAEASLAAPAEKDDGTIRLTPDKTKILTLDQDAGSIIVNNPAKAAIRMDTPRLLVVMPREPGTTSFTVLDKRGNTIMEKNVIVTAAQPKYVRIRRICQDSGGTCAESAYYYCPDGCYEVTPVEPNDQTDVPPIASAIQAGGVPEDYPDNLTPDEKDLYRQIDNLKQRNATPQEYLEVLQRAIDNGVIKPTDKPPLPTEFLPATEEKKEQQQ